MKPKEAWRGFTPEQARDFLRVGHVGRDHPSRLKTTQLLDGMTSVLDVGCGTGVMFELIRARLPEIEYLGIDVTPQLVAAARERFPADADRFREGSLYELDGLPGAFDAVICRHVLEHLPDYVPAVEHMYRRARQKLIIVFYLSPRPLRFRRKRDERFEPGFYTHTYDLGRFVDHLLTGLAPRPVEVRIHPGQGPGNPGSPWEDRENVIYEVLRST